MVEGEKNKLKNGKNSGFLYHSQAKAEIWAEAKADQKKPVMYKQISNYAETHGKNGKMLYKFKIIII